MVEIVGDVVSPSELILPVTTILPLKAGALIASGGVLYLSDGTDGIQIANA